jgi:hypothetical protein
MRYIKFRALHKDGTWRYGVYPYLTPDMSNAIYSLAVFWECINFFRRDTLGEFTGLHDKNGKEIYEGDIIQMYWRDGRKAGDIFAMSWNEKEARFTGYGPKDLAVVIGNIYENPELLKSPTVTMP